MEKIEQSVRLIYIEGHGPTMDDLQEGFWFRYYKSRLEIYNKEGDLEYFIKVVIGDSFQTTISGKQIMLKPIKMPQTRGGMVGYMLGCNRDMRVKRKEHIEKKQIRSVQANRIEGDNFQLIQVFDENWGWKNAAVWVANEISKEEILSLVPYMTSHSHAYNQALMKKYFDISVNEYNGALNSQPL